MNEPTAPGTYDCPIDGVPKKERRASPRPMEPDERVEALFNGFRNVIENHTDAYWVGYLQAMRDALAVLINDLKKA